MMPLKSTPISTRLRDIANTKFSETETHIGSLMLQAARELDVRKQAIKTLRTKLKEKDPK